MSALQIAGDAAVAIHSELWNRNAARSKFHL